MKKVYKVVSYDGMSLQSVTDYANTVIQNWENWETEIKFDVNKKTGAYYFILTIFN